ncbi:hypothetical protein AALO_G00096690 [Alosa alosa]|uniref:Fibrinogen C-terminal domain-containing protein n=1 Tax=Alosa alosa TaxID=278164 RepID=A0AAV6GSV7_9TELE|nr:hypothetical protein AALO_G00096690 [Alosa alosa]
MMVLFILLTLVPSCLCFTSLLPLDCSEIHSQDPTKPSGVYTIFPGGPVSPLQVYCDMETDGGGWTVFQRRLDGSVNFNRPWDHYKNGFGNKDGEYWLGLDNIVLLTMRKRNELRVDMEDWDGGKVYAQYTSFSVDPETFGYTLRVGSYVDGGAGDDLTYHNGMKFTTYDKDQDLHGDNCAKILLGAFWFCLSYSLSFRVVYVLRRCFLWTVRRSTPRIPPSPVGCTPSSPGGCLPPAGLLDVLNGPENYNPTRTGPWLLKPGPDVTRHINMNHLPEPGPRPNVKHKLRLHFDC